MNDPRIPGGRYFCGYWQQEYTVDSMFTAVSFDNGRYWQWATWFRVTWIPSEDALHPRASSQWRGDGYRKGSHCTAWDPGHDEIVRAPECCDCGAAAVSTVVIQRVKGRDGNRTGRTSRVPLCHIHLAAHWAQNERKTAAIMRSWR